VSATWRETPTADGSWTLFHAGLGEACHSSSGAWQQAVERYARACRLGERARAGEWRVCRLLDVGTGLGLNLAAALTVLDGSGVPLHALSLELDPEVVERGLALYERAELAGGPWEPWHACVRRALRAALDGPRRSVELGGAGVLELRLGDARATLLEGELGAFDAVFLDPFSPARAGELWEDGFLGEIARRMASGAWLSTYSAAFRVRLALAKAGLRVGRGPRVGRKGEGTLASPDREPPALGPRLERRLARRARSSPEPSDGLLRVRQDDRCPAID
jgi:tRNA U34 5-methylaminomethyl-2-thiouridine-forming methyltransferase MnmC